MKIKKAVIPIAGKGTRFLPATKAVAKEIIPIINIPMIHFVVEEAVKAGIEQIIFVTSSGKFSIEDYFDRNLELESFLERNNKHDELAMIKKIGSMVDITSVRQKEQLGLGHAIHTAKALVGNETFAVLLGDDITLGAEPVIGQLMKASEQMKNKSIIGVMEIDPSQTHRYGVIKGAKISDNMWKMTGMVEKPKSFEAPSNLATPGRYILTPDIFEALEKIPRGAGNEYQLTDAINMLSEKSDVYAHIFSGDRFDTGNIQGYLEATIEFALRDPKLNQDMVEILIKTIKKHGIKI